METSELKHINNNLDDLVKNTICNQSLLLGLQAAGILVDDDVVRVKTTERNYGNPSAALDLYNTVKTRKGSYAALHSVLKTIRQTGAADILARLDENELLGGDGSSKSETAGLIDSLSSKRSGTDPENPHLSYTKRTTTTKLLLILTLLFAILAIGALLFAGVYIYNTRQSTTETLLNYLLSDQSFRVVNETRENESITTRDNEDNNLRKIVAESHTENTSLILCQGRDIESLEIRIVHEINMVEDKTSCEKQLKQVTIKVPVSCEFFVRQISLSNAKNLSVFHTVDMEDFLHNCSSELSRDNRYRTDLFRLKYMNLQCRHCDTLLKVLKGTFKFSGLVGLSVNNFIITDSTRVTLKEFLETFTRLEVLTVNIELVTNLPFFPKTTIDTLKYLEIHVEIFEQDVLEVVFSQTVDFCRFVPNLESLSFSNWIYPIDSLNSCTNLRNLNLIMKYPEKAKIYNIVKFVEIFPFIRHVNLTLGFTDTSKCPPHGLLGWEELEQVPSLYSLEATSENCALNKSPRPSYLYSYFRKSSSVSSVL